MFMLFLTFVVFVLTLCVLCLLRIPSYRTYKLAQKIKGPNKYWIIGLAYEFVQNDTKTFLPYLRNLVEKNAGLVRFWLLGTPMVALVEPEHVKAILGNTKNLTKGWEYNVLKELLGEGLITGTCLWTERRKLLNPLLNYKNVDGKLTKSMKHVGKLVENLSSQQGKPVDIYACLAQSTLEYTCEAAMAVDLIDEDEIKLFRKSYRFLASGAALKAIRFYIKDWMYRYTYINKLVNTRKKFVNQFADKLINERRLNNTENLKYDIEEVGWGKKKLFLDTLVEPNNNRKVYLTDTDLRDEVKTFLIVGHESTAVTMEFALFHMAIDEEIQEKAFEEQYTIFGDSDRDPTYNDIQEMSYLTKIIKESLRLYPPVPYVTRELQEDTVCGDVLIPKGTNVITSPYVIHRQEKTFPDPDKFDPERFSPEEIEKRHPFAFIPFGAGPRYCIGQNLAMVNMKVYLSTILRKFKLKKVTEFKEVVLEMKVSLSTSKPIFIKLLPRE